MRGLTTYSWLILLSLSVFSLPLLGNDPVRPESQDDLTPNTYARDPVDHVPGGVPIGFSREQFLRDFPELVPYLQTEEQFQHYLANYLSLMGTEQHRLNGVRNTSIPTTPGRAFEVISRNASAGNLERGDVRAAFVEVRHPKTGAVIGLIGIKGIGFKESLGKKLVEEQRRQAKAIKATFEATKKQIQSDPTLSKTVKAQKLAEAKALFDSQAEEIFTRDHSSGLVTMGEAFHELAKQRTLQVAFDAYNHRHGTNFQTNEVYGIIALPFYIHTGTNKKERAALIIRQSEFRGPQFAAHRQAIPEKLFTDWHGFSQSTASNALIDFGGGLSDEPTLERAFGIPDPEQHTARNAQASRAWTIGHEISNWVDTERRSGNFTEPQANQTLKEHSEKTLAWMLEPVEHDLREAQKTLPAKPVHNFEDFATLWSEWEAVQKKQAKLSQSLLDRTVRYLELRPKGYAQALSAERRRHGQPDVDTDIIVTRRGESNVTQNDMRLFSHQRGLLWEKVRKHVHSLRGAEYLSAKKETTAGILAYGLLPEEKRATEAGQAILRRALISAMAEGPSTLQFIALEVIPQLTTESWQHPDMKGVITRLLTFSKAPLHTPKRKAIASRLAKNSENIPLSRLGELSDILENALWQRDADTFFIAQVVAQQVAKKKNLSLDEKVLWMAGLNIEDVRNLPRAAGEEGQWRHSFIRTFFPASVENTRYMASNINAVDLDLANLDAIKTLIEYLEKHELIPQDRQALIGKLYALARQVDYLPRDVSDALSYFLRSRQPLTLTHKIRDWCRTAYDAFQ